MFENNDTTPVTTTPATTAPDTATGESTQHHTTRRLSKPADALPHIPAQRTPEQLPLPLTAAEAPMPAVDPVQPPAQPPAQPPVLQPVQPGAQVPEQWTPSLQGPHVPIIQPILPWMPTLTQAQVFRPMGITKLNFGRLLRSQPEEILLATDTHGVHTLHNQGWLRAGATLHIVGWSPKGRLWHAHIRRTRSGRLICR